MAYSSKRKGGVIPKEVWKASLENGIDRKVVLSELKSEFVALLFKEGGYLERCYEICSERWGKALPQTKRMIHSWRQYDKGFAHTFNELKKQTNHVLMETALETHKRRIAHGDRELMVQNGKPVLTPRGMALKARLEAEEKAEWEVLEELSNRHDQSQDIYVVRVSYPENLVRQTLANVEAETFKSDYTPSKMSDDQIKALLAEAVAIGLPQKSQQTEQNEVIDGEIVD